jgi:hypothetical protein
MDKLAAFLYDRIQEEIEDEQRKRRPVPSIFDEHDVEIGSTNGVLQVFIDGHEYPADEYIAKATEPAADRILIEALRMRQRLLDFATWPSDHDAVRRAYTMTLEVLAAPYKRHPDFPTGEGS